MKSVGFLAVAVILAGDPSPGQEMDQGLRLPQEPRSQATGAQRLLRRIPACFVENRGQWSFPARYVSRMGPMTLFLEERGWRFTVLDPTAGSRPLSEACAPDPEERTPARPHGVAVRMTFAGAGVPEFVTEDRLPGHHNYLLGSDPAKWRAEVPLYGSIRLRGMYPGIDVRLREEDRHLEYDLLLEPGADLGQVVVEVEGARGLRLEGDGSLGIDTPLGEVRQPAPRTWEVDGSGEKRCVECRHRLLGSGRFGFDAPDRRPDRALMIDPGLVYSTFLGGSSYEEPRAVAVEPSGSATVAGNTASFDFPTTLGALDTTFGGGTALGGDAFVTRLSPSGASLDFSTFLGGAGDDFASAIALDSMGAATVAGSTSSSDLPTTPGAFDTSFNGGPLPWGGDAFVARLSPSGGSLVYSTFLGGSEDDGALALALDGVGDATVAGWTYSPSFPTTSGAFDTSFAVGSGGDAFVAQLSPSGTGLAFSTFLGGTNNEYASGVALDVGGTATLAGQTDSGDFPTSSGAFDTTFNGAGAYGGDAFVAQLSSSGASLAKSTFLGGTEVDRAHALALDSTGAATVAGETGSSNFPTTVGAFDTSYNGTPLINPPIRDAFVTRLSPSGAGLFFSTFLGGFAEDLALAVAVDASQAAIVAGVTTSSNFPTTPGAFDTTFASNDAFLVRLSPSGGGVSYSTFLGGTDGEYGFALALDATGTATLAGTTTSADFPTTTGAFDTTFNGSSLSGDGFVARLDLLPAGASIYGDSSAGCDGPLPIGVTSWPQVGNAAFAITCANAPANASGLLGLSGGALASPALLLGLQIWIDLASPPFFALAATSDGIGSASVPIPVPNDPTLAGGQVYAQFAWIGPNSPPPCPPTGLSASNALGITVQP